MKVYFFAAEFRKNIGQSISWKAERRDVDDGSIMATKKIIPFYFF